MDRSINAGGTLLARLECCSLRAYFGPYAVSPEWDVDSVVLRFWKIAGLWNWVNTLCTRLVRSSETVEQCAMFLFMNLLEQSTEVRVVFPVLSDNLGKKKCHSCPSGRLQQVNVPSHRSKYMVLEEVIWLKVRCVCRHRLTGNSTLRRSFLPLIQPDKLYFSVFNSALWYLLYTFCKQSFDGMLTLHMYVCPYMCTFNQRNAKVTIIWLKL